jgi:glycerate 2-kinase
MNVDRVLAPVEAALAHPQAFLAQLYWAAVNSALPLHSMAAYLPQPPKGRTVVVGAGKAAGAMAQALESLWPVDAPLSGTVVTRYGHIPPRPTGLAHRIEVLEAAHPVPDAAGMAAAQRMLSLTHGLTADDLVLCLVSGGGSALLAMPVEGVTLHEKQGINQALLGSSASIAEINVVRKHLSRIKGGQLALACAPARVVTLAISDVPGDDPATIASGPTVPDASTCADALAIVDRYRIAVPKAVLNQWQRGALETPKPNHPAFSANANAVHLIATPQQALEAAAARARAAGIAAYILSDQMEGESREVGRVHAALARAVAKSGQPFAKPCVILSGGETTVTLRSSATHGATGRGGRAGEFCLGLAFGLQGAPGVYALAADTDGIDGVESNAGAWVLPDTLPRAQHKGLAVADALDRNDAHGFFAALDDLFVTGPTHTNVNDFRAILVR